MLKRAATTGTQVAELLLQEISPSLLLLQSALQLCHPFMQLLHSVGLQTGSAGPEGMPRLVVCADESRSSSCAQACAHSH